MSPITLGILASSGGGLSFWISSLGNSSFNLGCDSSSWSGGIYRVGQNNDSQFSNKAMSITKTDVNGNGSWQKQLPSSLVSTEQTPNGLSSDSAGNVYISSRNTVSGVVRPYLIKYDSNGSIQWQRNLNNFFDFYGSAIDSSGNVFARTGDTNTAFVIMKISPSGALLWQRQTQGQHVFGGGAGHDLAIDSVGNVLAVGRDSGLQDNYLIKYDTNGTRLFERRVNSTPGNFTSVGVDSSDNIYCFGDRNQANPYLVKFASNGTTLWQRFLHSSLMNAFDLAVAPNGDTYALLDSGSAYIVKLNADGTTLWQRQITSGSTNYRFHSIALGEEGALYVSGFATNDNNRQTAITIKLPTDGSLTGTYTHEGRTYTYAASSLTQTVENRTIATTNTTLTTPTHTLSASSLSEATTAYATTKTTI